MRLIIEKDYDALSKWAAEYVIKRINEFNPTPEHRFVLGLPTGSSPIGMYKELVKACKEGRVSFKNVVTWMSTVVYLNHILKATILLWQITSLII